jgi:hypothetical protein
VRRPWDAPAIRERRDHRPTTRSGDAWVEQHQLMTRASGHEADEVVETARAANIHDHDAPLERVIEHPVIQALVVDLHPLRRPPLEPAVDQRVSRTQAAGASVCHRELDEPPERRWISAVADESCAPRFGNDEHRASDAEQLSHRGSDMTLPELGTRTCER